MGHNGKQAMNYEETILVSLNLSSSWQSIRPSYPKYTSSITGDKAQTAETRKRSYIMAGRKEVQWSE